MTKPAITKREVKGLALTYSELDTNFQNLRDATVSLTAGTGGTQVVSDLNGNITLVAGTGITLSGDNTAKTLTINGVAPQLFSTIAVAGQSDIVADSASDTLTLVAGTNISITTNATTDTLTINGAATGLENVIEDTTPQLGGNLDLNGFAITTTTGGIKLERDSIVLGDGAGTVSITTLNDQPLTIRSILSATSALFSATDIALFASSGKISTTGAGIVQSGFGGASKLTTANSSTNLTLSTNDGGSPSNTIALTAGSNGNITISCNGTGKVIFNSPTVLDSMTTAERDASSPSNGMIIYNSSTNTFQGRASGAWVDLH